MKDEKLSYQDIKKIINLDASSIRAFCVWLEEPHKFLEDKKPMRVLIIILLLSSLLEAKEIGIASWYSVRTNGGTHTASGEKLKNSSLTAAHKTLPFGTKIRVTCIKNKKSVVVRINDRGPFVSGRIIDLTKAAFSRIMPLKKGIGRVKVEVIK